MFTAAERNCLLPQLTCKETCCPLQIGWEGAAVQSTHHVNRRWGADRKTHSVDEVYSPARYLGGSSFPPSPLQPCRRLHPWVLTTPGIVRPPTQTAEKLDSLMELTLLHISRRCQAGQLEDVWATVMVSRSMVVPNA